MMCLECNCACLKHTGTAYGTYALAYVPYVVCIWTGNGELCCTGNPTFLPLRVTDLTRGFSSLQLFFTYCLIQQIQKSAHLMPGFCGVKKSSLRYIIKFSCSSRTFFTFASSRHSLQRAYQVSKGCLCWKVSDKGEVQQNKELNIPWNAVRAVKNKQRKYGTTMTLQKPMKRRKQIREAIKRRDNKRAAGFSGKYWSCATCDNNLCILHI